MKFEEEEYKLKMPRNQSNKTTLTDKQKFELCQQARDNKEALKSLENVKTFLTQQEGASSYLKAVNSLEKFIRKFDETKQHSTILS